jgi:catechol 2,3-dioxygenase-like lactoylglutathione lyase family enzyme
MAEAAIRGIFNVKIPVTDVARSRAWYEEVFGFEVELEFPDEDGVVRGVAGHLPGAPDTHLSLRENPTAARGVAGADLLGLSIDDRDAAEAWAVKLDGLGIDHSPIIDATIGWLLVFHDPDGIELHLYSQERHGIDQTGRPGYGRRTIRA